MDYGKYDVSVHNGFLPINPNGFTEKLPSSYDLWEEIVSKIPIVAPAGGMNFLVDTLPIADTKYLTTLPQIQRAYSILCYITQAYVWEDNKNPKREIPPQLAVPLLEVSEKLGLQPILTHASVDLFNWRKSDNNKPLSLENIEIINSFTNSEDERWFYKIHIVMEFIGAKLIGIGKTITETTNVDELKRALDAFTQEIRNITTHIAKIRENCGPKFFYGTLRWFFNGWTKKELFPNGMCYKTPSGDRWLVIGGGSAAQSSLIQFIDRVLGVEHEGKNKEFLDEMLDYMPRNHRLFLKELSKHSIRGFVNQTGDDSLTDSYNVAIAALTSLRKQHMSIVAEYVIKPAEEEQRAQGALATQTMSSGGQGGERELLGSGGTELVKFLKGAINETQSTKLSNANH